MFDTKKEPNPKVNQIKATRVVGYDEKITSNERFKAQVALKKELTGTELINQTL